MNKAISEYATLVFDCDGVVLNSNKIKTQAFYEATKHYGHEAAQALVNYHVSNGGISRYAKFRLFITDILQQEFEESLYQRLLDNFANAVIDGLLKSEVAQGLAELRKKTINANWLIVSGGDQAELQEVFTQRKLAAYFTGGIFGSPDTKDIILAREIASGNITMPALFIGDSKYDYAAANTAELDFVFLTDWTEVKDHKEWCELNQLTHLPNLNALTIESLSG